MQAGEQRTMLNIAPRKKRIVSGLTSLSLMISSTTRRTSREFTLDIVLPSTHMDDVERRRDVSDHAIVRKKHTQKWQRRLPAPA